MALELRSEAADTPRPPGFFRRTKSRRGRVSDKERMFFTEQLALLLETGTNLHAGLRVLKGQVQSPAMESVIEALISDVAGGKSFSQALARHPQVFTKTYVNLIAASEGGGFMYQVLQQLLEMDEKRGQLRSTMVSALSYPVFLLVFALAVVIFVLVVVFPKFAEMFSLIQDQLPPTTVFLMAASDFLRNQWVPLLGAIALAMSLLRYWMATPGGTQTLDRLKIRLPGIGAIFIKLYLVQSLRVMSLSLDNGVGIVDTLHACREVVRNRLFQRFIESVEGRVQEGGGIAAGFSGSDFIPPIVEQMITTGEETGNLPKVMGRLADFYERELGKRLDAVSRLAEPVMLLVMGAVVGLLVSSLILPIFKLSRAVH